MTYKSSYASDGFYIVYSEGADGTKTVASIEPDWNAASVAVEELNAHELLTSTTNGLRRIGHVTNMSNDELAELRRTLTDTADSLASVISDRKYRDSVKEQAAIDAAQAIADSEKAAD